ncbi:MAG: hypothetical protein JWO36_333 [Myxococcales bacterium]|nr:hypothetical protein [Myxococcales bacterium]
MVAVGGRQVRVRVLMVVMIAARVRMCAVRVLVRRVMRNDDAGCGLGFLHGDVTRSHGRVATERQQRDRQARDQRAHGFFFAGLCDIFFLSASSSASTVFSSRREVLPDPCPLCDDDGAPALAPCGFAAPG